jgi:hypothetical protein
MHSGAQNFLSMSLTPVCNLTGGARASAIHCRMEFKMKNPSAQAQKSIEDNARRAAKSVGWIAKKSRQQLSRENQGGFVLIDPKTNAVLSGEGFDLTPRDVFEMVRMQKR